MQGVTAEYGPARAQKNQTGKWYPQIPVDHTTLQINQRVVNTTLIPVKLEHWVRWLGAHLKLFPCSLTAAHHVQLAIGPGRPASSHYLFAVRTSIDLGVLAADCEPDLQ